MKRWRGKILAGLLLGCSLAPFAFGQEFNREEKARTALSVGTSVVSTTLARADLVMAKSVINPKHLAGDVTEHLAEKVFVREVLSSKRGGSWKGITPRSGRQGLDHVFIKTDKNGVPRDLIVGESKYNTSKLGETKSGIQGSKGYIEGRLRGLSTRYNSVAQEKAIVFSKAPLNPNRQVSVVLKNGKTVHFWKESSTGKQWKFTGKKSQLPEAQKLAETYANFLGKAGNGVISFRSRIFHAVPNGNKLTIDVYDAKNLDAGVRHIEGLKKLSSIRVSNVVSGNTMISKESIPDIAGTIKSKLGYSDAEAIAVAKDLRRQYNAGELQKQTSLLKSILTNPVAAAGIMFVADTGIQLVMSGEIDYKQLGLTGTATFAGVGAGQFVHAGIPFAMSKCELARKAVVSFSRFANISTKATSTALAGFSGGAVTSLVLSYGGLLMGYSDLETANRQAFAGVVGAGAGAVAATGAMSAIAAFGTASTGTAISSLSGAAATNASLAWLGGGSLATGGGGVALGSAVLTGGTIIIAIGAVILVDKCFELYDENEERKRLIHLAETYSKDEEMDKILKNNAYGRSLGFKAK